MGKVKNSKAHSKRDFVSLADQIDKDKLTKPTSHRVKIREKQEETEYVDHKLTKKILNQAREQQLEMEEECGIGNYPNSSKPLASILKKPSLGDDTVGSEDDSDISEDDDSEAYDCEMVEVDEEDAKALERFMAPDPPARRNLADIIMEKFTEKRTEIASQMSESSYMNVEQMNPRTVEMYRGIRDILVKYRSGKLPKAFKFIPHLSNWEQVLAITEPEKWSPAAMYQATRMFASNLKDRMAQRFYNLILLPRVRDDIAETKKLNFHLYQSLRKSLFKTGAFFKGILLPLCEGRDCTLREATIVGSILVKNSIPMLHSSAAMLKIAEMEYSGANSIFLRILLDKKYALPFRVIDAVVYHFLKFEYDKRELPVLWHQSLLVFAQRYKEDMSSEQKTTLLQLLKVHSHPTITHEIRRELQNSKCRDAEVDEPMVN